ncbi:hypothetical protein IU501_15760 [Nocardia otitidiscaviarum]|uniref:hypothetical protein n=1 Tax=Nocardia otitidiscaviarum TaxID=1823 RepID=UPI0018943C7F|nr:hypothetical protein [Nocardia otitidiscaviarum]MBF6134452.1 hypothetical protein [Nocardia otitidiscaviarum]
MSVGTVVVVEDVVPVGEEFVFASSLAQPAAATTGNKLAIMRNFEVRRIHTSCSGWDIRTHGSISLGLVSVTESIE